MKRKKEDHLGEKNIHFLSASLSGSLQIDDVAGYLPEDCSQTPNGSHISSVILQKT